jgi:hypothetical protein
MQPGDQRKNRVRRSAVEVPGGLIRQQDPGLGDERTGQSYTLLLAAGKFSGTMMRTLLQSYLVQPPHSFSLRLLPGNIPQQQRHGHIFQGRKFRQQVMELPNKAKFAVTKLSRAIIR